MGIPQLFTNLRKFCLYDRNKRRLLMLYLLPLLTFAQNIESLELTCRNIFGERRLENLRKLRKLRIHYRDDWTFEKFSGLIDCLETNPELKMLERFEDRDLGNIYDRFGKSLHNRYSFLSSFQHLSYVALTSYTFCGSDLYYPLKVMDGRNIVRLKILMSYQPPIVLQERKTDKILRRRVPKFPSLQSVEMEIFDQDVVIYEPESTQCDIRCKFLFHFLAQQKNVQHFEFVGGSLNNMHKILDVVPNIRTLDVSGTAVLFEESREMVPKIVQTLRTYRQSKNNQKLPLLRLILSYDFIIPANNDYGDCVRISFESKV
ncbi:hypothetical protein Bhyg_11240 [Pseudolycoriella hygida]|uniref:Uncharacterized protein n=1 Tax=Pseudolycoriella hygida TaxID=35572 RepID=A0A9Q0MVW5_9DIPT|nr:hypothetical protein Bhyg_11240 [Pseudolycoriella hygida]